MKLGVSILPEDAQIQECVAVSKTHGFKGFSIRQVDLETFGGAKELIFFLKENQQEAIQIFCWEF